MKKEADKIKIIENNSWPGIKSEDISKIVME